MNTLLRFRKLRQAYQNGSATPMQVADDVIDRIARHGDPHIWTAISEPAAIQLQAQALHARRGEMARLPLYGLPFGVKDNVDVEGIPTTCGCPAFSRMPVATAEAVRRAIDAGALFIGKQTLDQFATGLNGTRTLGGHCRNVFDPAKVPGGSSSGSGVAVAAGLVSFSLGSDTGGSGRVPAAMNNIVGLRPTVGLVSSRGMVYNNRMFDCMPVFAPGVEEAYTVLEAIAGCDVLDPIGRNDADSIELDTALPTTFRFAVPDRLEYFGDALGPGCWEAAVEQLRGLGGTPVTLDFGPFLQAGRMIFDSALVAERAASYGIVLDDCPDQLVPAVASILERARRYTAVEAFQAQYRLGALRRHFDSQLQGIDVLVTPTIPRHYGVDEMRAEPLLRNAEIGYYTYGVGPLDLCALAVPASIRPDGLPFGISLVARAAEDGKLRALGRRFEAAAGLPPGIEAIGR